MQKKNVKSDFVLRMRLRDCRGELIGWPDFDWRAKFRTDSPRGCYVAQCVGGVPTRCFEDRGEICVVFHRHGLMSGQLRVEFDALHPDGVMPDGLRREVTPDPLDVYLTYEKGDCATEIEVELALPLIKGDPGEPFRYEDFTAEQKAELIAPIKEDIDKAITQKQDSLSVSDDFRLTETAELSLTEQAKRQVFDDLFTSAAGAFGTIDHTHYDEDGTHTPYCLNELWFTYEDMVKIYNRSSLQPYDFGEYRFGASASNGEAKNVVLCRTYMPLLIPAYEPGKIFNRLFQNNNKLVTFSYVGGYNAAACSMISGDYAFYGCTSLKSIPELGRWNGKDAFYNCISLEEIRLNQLLYDVDLHWSPLISLESFRYMVANRSHLSPDKVITVTVHPDIYAKLTDESNEEWHAVLLTALEKNIAFATV